MKIIPYLMIWEGLVTRYHKKQSNEIRIHPKTEAYIRSPVLKKTFESISFERGKGIEDKEGKRTGK